MVADPALMRPVEPARLCGDASRARARLGWAPTREFAEIIREMVLADLAAVDAAASDLAGAAAATRAALPG